MSRNGQARKLDDGYAMAALLVAIAVMGIVMSVALPVWKQAVRREKEEELVFRGQQYVRAVQLFQRRFPGAYPPDLDTLVNQRFLRKKYKDPMAEDGEFEILYQGSRLTVNINPGGQQTTPGFRVSVGQTVSPGQSLTFDSGTGAVTQVQRGGRGGASGAPGGPRGGVIGVRSTNTDESIRIYNGATHYNQWQFIYVPTNVGRGGQMQPGPSRGGAPGTGPGIGPGSGGGRGGRGGGPYGPGGQRGGPGGPPQMPGFRRGGLGQ